MYKKILLPVDVFEMDFSNNEAFDVIVIGSRKPGISTHLLGSNAESILRYAKTPVLVVR